MRRRRFPGRPIRRSIRGLSPRRPVPPKLREANQLYAADDFEKAVLLYLELAERAEMKDLPQAANLYLHAAISSLKNADLERTETLLKRSFAYCVRKRRWPQLERVMNAASMELDAAGQGTLKAELFAWVQDQNPDEAKIQLPQTAGGAAASQAAQLPVHCQNCGGPVQPQEVEWYDSENPICAFCGSILRNE